MSDFLVGLQCDGARKQADAVVRKYIDRTFELARLEVDYENSAAEYFAKNKELHKFVEQDEIKVILLRYVLSLPHTVFMEKDSGKFVLKFMSPDINDFTNYRTSAVMPSSLYGHDLILEGGNILRVRYIYTSGGNIKPYTTIVIGPREGYTFSNYQQLNNLKAFCKEFKIVVNLSELEEIAVAEEQLRSQNERIVNGIDKFVSMYRLINYVHNQGGWETTRTAAKKDQLLAEIMQFLESNKERLANVVKKP